jgi:hypothetical protein
VLRFASLARDYRRLTVRGVVVVIVVICVRVLMDSG